MTVKTNIRSILGLFKNNWHLKIASVFIAIVVWFIVVQYVNPEDTRTIEDIRIEINTVDSIPIAQGLIMVTDYDNSVSVTYTAGRDTIAMLDVKKIKAYVDLSSATKPGEYNLPITIDTEGQNIKVVNQTVKTAKLKFEKKISASIDIKTIASGIVPDGYLKYDPEPVLEKLKIDGPESKVSQIKYVEAIIPESTFTETKSYDCEYRFLDESGNTVSKEYITSEQEKLKVDVTVLMTKEIPIKGSLINSSGGYESSFASLYIDPATILIAGSEEALKAYNSYTLDPIDVAEKNGDFEQPFSVSLESGLVNVNNVEKINASVVFGDVITKKIEFKTFKILNAPKDKKVKIINDSCVITFRGMVDDIAKINSDNVEIQIDLKDEIDVSGQQKIPLHAVIPSDYKVGVVGKYYLTVEIS